MAIHIKKSHRGRFTAYKKRTGKTTAEALHSKNPHVRAMANFARNARKWKHELGGYIDMFENGSYLPEFGLGGEEPLFTTTTGNPNVNIPTLASASNSLRTNNPEIFDNTSLQPSNIGSGVASAASSMGGSVGTVASIVQAIGQPIADLVSGTYEDKMNKTYAGASKGLRQLSPDQVDKLALQGTVTGAMDYWQAGPLSFIGSLLQADKEREKAATFNQGITKQTNMLKSARRTTAAGTPNAYQPVGFAKQGGFISYKGETHKGPNGGILVDEQGNPTGQTSNATPVALTEKNEVSRYDPNTHSTYIYSDSLGFAKPANDLLRKYKLNKPESLQYAQYKNDTLTKAAVDRQFDNLTTAQEFSKETKTPKEDALGMFKKGGSLTSWKARKMLEDNSAQGHPLTAKQKKLFRAVSHGWHFPQKDQGGSIYSTGTTHDIDEQEYNRLLSMGYKLEIL